MVILECLYRDRKLDQVNERFDRDLVAEIERKVWQKPDLNILDIGCGKNGNSVEDIARMYPSVTAVGVDPTCNRRGQRKSHLVSGDLFHLPLQSRFDLIYSAFVFLYVGISEKTEHEHTTAKAVIEVSDMLNPDGVAMVGESRYLGLEGGLNDLTRKIVANCPDYFKKFQLRRLGNEENEYIWIGKI